MKYLVCWVLVIAGLFFYFMKEETFQNGKLRIAYALTSIFIGMIVLFIFILPQNTLIWVCFLVAGVSLILGIVIGHFIVKFDKVNAFTFGFWDGFILGLLIHEAILYNSSLVWLFWTICGVLALAGGLLSFWF